MTNRENEVLYFKLKYAFMHLLENDTILHSVYNHMKIGSTGGVRTESSMPIHFIKLAERMASRYVKITPINTYEQSILNIYLKHPKIIEILKGKDVASQTVAVRKTEVHLVSSLRYNTMLSLLDPDLRAMLDDEIRCDNYYLVKENHKVIGGFGTNANGELKGLFSLVKGKGREIFKLRLKQAKIDADDNIKYFRIDCIGEKLVEFYKEFGFHIEGSVKWDSNYATKNWNYDRFGSPNVYIMFKEI